jgi:hypothetical protein
MRSLIAAALYLGFSNFAFAQAGCALDPSGNSAVSALKDVHLQFKPTNDRPNQVCTGDGTVCLYSDKNGTEPCKQEYDPDTHKPAGDPLCGKDLLAAQQQAQDAQYLPASQNNKGQTGPQTNNFYYTFVPVHGKYIIDIEPQKSASDSQRDSGKDLKIIPADQMGSNDVTISTYNGGEPALSQCAIETSSQGLGAAAGGCPSAINLTKGDCTARRDANGNWFSVSNSSGKNNFVATQQTYNNPLATSSGGQTTPSSGATTGP